MLAFTLFLLLLALGATAAGAYLVGAWLVQNRPDSPLGALLKTLPMYTTYERKGREEEARNATQVRETVSVASAKTKSSKRWSFRNLGENDSIVISQPDTGEEVTFRVVGTALTNELVQEDDSSRTNPWFSTGRKLVFQVLAGKRSEWLVELPNGFLALITDINEVGDAVIQRFVRKAQAFGESGQSATNITIEWEGQVQKLWDIGRLGVHSTIGEKAPWRAAPTDPDDKPWKDNYIQKFLMAGPQGGKNADHTEGEEVLMIFAPVIGTGGWVLKGFLINENYLQDVRSEG